MRLSSSERILTLEQWQEHFPDYYIGEHLSGCKYIHASAPLFMNNTASWELFHLTDYRVTSYTGGSYWLERII